MVELVDLYSTLAELGGVPPPKKTDGKSFAPVFDNPDFNTKEAAFSQYNRCPKDMKKLWMDHNCAQIQRQFFTVMGYSIRTKAFRYTKWLSWNGTKLAGEWDKKAWGEELYDHRNDTGFDMDMPAEAVNVVSNPKFANFKKELLKELRNHFEKTDEELEKRNRYVTRFWYSGEQEIGD